MSCLDKVNALTMFIDVLAEHEKQLDSSIERLEKAIEEANAATEKASKKKNIYLLTIINEIKI